MPPFHDCGSDRFTVVVDVDDNGYPAEAKRILEGAGAESIRDLDMSS